MATPFEPVFRVSYGLKSDGRERIHRKYFSSAEECRAWYIENRARFTSSTIVELNHISLDRLIMLAQLECECTELGCE